MTEPPVLIVIPCLNEEAHLRAVVDSLLNPLPAMPVQLVIADGGSTDGTRKIAEDLMQCYPQIIWLDNPKRIQAAAVNLAVERYGRAGGILIRADAHNVYPPHYVDMLSADMQSTGADSVTVPMTTI
ncbi:MAG: glycosyltransferase, partial [Alphaproteobacteria bacterium]|nr:glycosyltransferase [Alphaproteobacteria bacterium]